MKLTNRELKRIIMEELKTEQINEGIENITPENIGIAIDAIIKMKYLLLPLIGSAGVAAVLEALKNKKAETGDPSLGTKDL